jgi:hypothetical protein
MANSTRFRVARVHRPDLGLDQHGMASRSLLTGRAAALGHAAWTLKVPYQLIEAKAPPPAIDLAA